MSALQSLAAATVAGDIGTLVGQIVFAFCILIVAIWGQISQGNRALKMGQDIAFGFFAVFVWFIGMAQLISGHVSGLALVIVTILMGTALFDPIRKATWARVLPIEPESRMHMLGLICLLFAVAIFFLTSASVADSIDQPTDSVSVYDPGQPKPASGINWMLFDPLPAPRKAMGFVAEGTTLYVIGGEDTSGTVAGVTAYNIDLRDHPVVGQLAGWTPKAPLPEPQSHLAVAVLDGKIYAVGGERGGVPVPTASVYDPATNLWSTLPPLPAARTDIAAAAVNGKLYVLGGATNSSGHAAPQGLDTVSVYDPATRQWTAGAPMPTARSGLAAVTLNGRIFALGGQNSGTSLKTMEVYDPQKDTWGSAPTMLDSRSNLAATTRSDMTIYALGGFGDGETSNSVQVFDAQTGKWTSGPSMVSGAAGLGVAIVAGKIYTAGGAKDQLGQIVPHGGLVFTIGEAIILIALAVALVGVGVRRTQRPVTGPVRLSRAAIAASRGVIATSTATAEPAERFVGGVRFTLRRTPAEIRTRLGLGAPTPFILLVAVVTAAVLVGVAIGGEKLTELLSPTIAANVEPD